MADVPHDLAVEESVLGACLTYPRALGQVGDVVIAGDFYRPAHAALFGALTAVYAEAGDPTSTVVVVDAARRLGEPVEPELIRSLVFRATASWVAGAAVVARLASLRRLMGLAAETASACADLGADPALLVDGLRVGLDAVDLPLGRLPADYHDFEAYVKVAGEPVPWVVPDVLGRQHRAFLVAAEGTIKTSLSRQIGLLASQGMHPFTLHPMPPIRVLFCDFENPRDYLSRWAEPIFDYLRLSQGDLFDPARTRLWHRPAGADLRSRAGRADFVAVIADHRPDLVSLGPLYKAYRRSSRESDEDAAVEVQALLDDLRVRYDFALLIEHHAPKGYGGKREMDPYGSSLWMRWPEFGISLSPAKAAEGEPAGAMKVGRFRGDRLEARWPERLDVTTSGVPWRWSAWREDKLQAEPEEVPDAF